MDSRSISYKATGRDDIVAIHAEGARSFGFSDDRWTTARLADAIEKRFGIKYDQDHVGRLMHSLGLRKPKFHYIFQMSNHHASQPQPRVPNEAVPAA